MKLQDRLIGDVDMIKLLALLLGKIAYTYAEEGRNWEYTEQKLRELLDEALDA